MSGQNTLIIANDYNVIQSKIALVMGSGSGNKGYGQTLDSSQVAQNAKISVTQWNNLRNDIVRARQHQTGTLIGNKAPGDTGYTAGSDLPIPTAATQVKETWRAAYLSMATDADTNYLTVPVPAGESTVASLTTNQIRTAVWNTSVQQTVSITWPTADDARYFFNTGGQIQISSDFVPRVAGIKNSTWVGMLSGMGTICIRHNTTVTSGGSGSTVGVGFYNATTSDGLIFEKDAPNPGQYWQNKFYIMARVNSTGSDRRILYLTLVWADDSPAPPSYPDPGFGIDEQVDGTLTSYVQCLRATGSNVSVPLPTGGTTPIA